MRIAVAMSGGIDSSLAAIILKQAGHEVVGITAKILLCAEMDGSEPRFDVCCSPENIRDAKALACQFGFPHMVINVEDDFSREVIDPFCREYLQGRTPSPCIPCNARIKFKKIFDAAREMGCERIATGHYARTGTTPDGRSYISAGIDADKDQSYFLFMLDQEIVRSLLLPLGTYTKTEIREMARGLGLAIADKPESQEICFVLDNDYPRYIERRTGIVPPPGDIVDSQGRVIGRHTGIHRYTIGQRRGLGIAAPRPLYVIAVDAANNRVIAGYKEELRRSGLFASNLHAMKSRSFMGQCQIKTRSTQKAFGAMIREGDGGVYADFLEPQEGITPGQAAVFYDETGAILGGGWIERSY